MGSLTSTEDAEMNEDNTMCFTCIELSTLDGSSIDCQVMLQKFIAAATELLCPKFKACNLSS